MSDIALRTDGQLVLPDDATPEETVAFAHDMRLAGHTWVEIRDACGYSTDTLARLQVRNWLQKAAMALDEETKGQHLALELERLDKLQNAVWEAALTGDNKAIDTALKIIQMRSRMLGLEEIHTEVTNHVQTVVVSKDEYVSRLKQIAGHDE